MLDQTYTFTGYEAELNYDAGKKNKNSCVRRRGRFWWHCDTRQAGGRAGGVGGQKLGRISWRVYMHMQHSRLMLIISSLCILRICGIWCMYRWTRMIMSQMTMMYIHKNNLLFVGFWKFEWLYKTWHLVYGSDSHFCPWFCVGSDKLVGSNYLPG